MGGRLAGWHTRPFSGNHVASGLVHQDGATIYNPQWRKTVVGTRVQKRGGSRAAQTRERAGPVNWSPKNIDHYHTITSLQNGHGHTHVGAGEKSSRMGALRAPPPPQDPVKKVYIAA